MLHSIFYYKEEQLVRLASNCTSMPVHHSTALLVIRGAKGRGPYSDVQAAMDAMGLPKDKRPKHQRWIDYQHS